MIRKRPFGRMQDNVSEIGFGAWPIGGHEGGGGGYGPVEEEDAIEAIEAYLEAGGNFIDTARAYGRSEERIGRRLKTGDRRRDVFIATKTGATKAIESHPNIRRDVETSLDLLDTDYVDLLQMHAPPEDPDIMNRALDIFEELKQEGKIRGIGASIKGPFVGQATVDLCRQYIDTGRIDAIQLIYSILRQKNAEILDYAKSNGVAIIARTVLESGFLTGKYHKSTIFTDHRKRWGKERLEAILSKVEELKEEAVPPPYDSITQVALRFPLEHDGVSCIIPGAKNRRQVEMNTGVADLPPLDEALVRKLRTEYAGLEDLVNPGD